MSITNCKTCKRPLEGLRSPLSGKYLSHIHTEPQDSETVARIASVMVAALPFYLLAMGWL